MKIKIIKCSRKDYWYNNLVGKIYEVEDGKHGAIVVEKIVDKRGTTSMLIVEGDYAIIKNKYFQEDLEL